MKIHKQPVLGQLIFIHAGFSCLETGTLTKCEESNYSVLLAKNILTCNYFDGITESENKCKTAVPYSNINYVQTPKMGS